MLDPFVGSGTTLTVAHSLGRNSVGIEIMEKYHEIGVKQLESSGAKVFKAGVHPKLKKLRNTKKKKVLVKA